MGSDTGRRAVRLSSVEVDCKPAGGPARPTKVRRAVTLVLTLVSRAHTALLSLRKNWLWAYTGTLFGAPGSREIVEAWTEQYGGVFKRALAFGGSDVSVADPKAAAHILNGSDVRTAFHIFPYRETHLPAEHLAHRALQPHSDREPGKHLASTRACTFLSSTSSDGVSLPPMERVISDRRRPSHPALPASRSVNTLQRSTTVLIRCVFASVVPTTTSNVYYRLLRSGLRSSRLPRALSRTSANGLARTRKYPVHAKVPFSRNEQSRYSWSRRARL
jgi:hypothetical protein